MLMPAKLHWRPNNMFSMCSHYLGLRCLIAYVLILNTKPQCHFCYARGTLSFVSEAVPETP